VIVVVKVVAIIDVEVAAIVGSDRLVVI